MSDYEESSSDEKPSREFEERLSVLKANWKAALKRNKKLLLKCPNYDRCGFKCGSIGGMSYHFVRCAGQQPEFKCALCSRSYESRTGLNYHMASSHHDAIPDELKNETTGRPQRSAALTTMSAIHIANNLPPLKQAFHKPPSYKTTPQSSTHNTTPPKKTASPTSARKNTPPSASVAPAKTVHPQKLSPSQKSLPSPILKAATPMRTTPPAKTTPPSKISPPTPVAKEPRNLPDKMVAKFPQPTIVLPRAIKSPPPPLPRPQLIAELIQPKKSPLLSPSPLPKVEESEKSKRGRGRYITIPSIEYPDEYKSFLPLWRQEMKDNTIIKCPNFSECEFKCTTVNGMKYHYVRCMKTNPPEFNCELCEKRFQCRTGLVWHLKKTHKMIDIHPTKSGGYKGSLPIELKFDSDLEDEDDDHMMEAFQLPQVISPVRKKIKLNEPWKRPRRHGGTTSDDSALESSTQSGSDGDDERELSCDDRPSSRKRFRKSFWPRRTADFILQNLTRVRLRPKPRLGPETSKFYIPSIEFSVYDEIATDIDPKPSTILSLGVEALEWRRMYSDSDSESDYNPEYDDIGQAINYQSNSSVSDSDEEFMCSLTRKKTTGQRGPKPRAGVGGGHIGGERPRRGRGRGSRISEASNREAVPMLVKPPEDVNYGSMLDAGVQPPPILIKHQLRDGSSVVVGSSTSGEEGRASEVRVAASLPSVPALVKTANRKGNESSDIEEFDRLTSIPMQPSIHPPHHIQPPPSLVMPLSSSSTSQHGHSPSSSARRREPPPLVKNSDSKQLTTNAAMAIQNSSHSTHPQIIRLSPSEVPGQLQKKSIGGGSSLSHTLPTRTPQPSYSIVTQQVASSPTSAGATFVSPEAPPPKPRRPGRPRKDQSVTLSAGLRTSSKTVRLGAGRSQGRSSGRGRRGGHTASPVTKKSMKMTQYEFENVHFSPAVGHAPSTLQQPHQPQLFQVNSGGGGVAQNLQGLVTPLQIIPAGSIPGYPSVAGGSVLLMQGAPQGVTLATPPTSHSASTTLIPQGGNTFQLVQAAPVISADQVDNAQKVSVIMHPAAAGGVQYIAQFDGPPPKAKGKRRSSAELKELFEEERKKEQNKLQDSAPSTSVATSSKVAESAEKSTSPEISAEKLMSNELEKYFKTEETRRTKTAAASVSSAKTPRTSARRKRPLPSPEGKATGSQSTEASPSSEGKQEESPSSKSKAAKTRKRKSVLGKRTRTRAQVKKEAEEYHDEEGDPLTSPSPSKQKKTADSAESGETSSGRTGVTSLTAEGEDVPEALLVEGSSASTAADGGECGDGDTPTVKSKPTFTCEDCGKVYRVRSSFLSHRKQKHEARQPLTASSSLQECTVEWRQTLKRQKKITCPKCGTHKSTTIGGLKYHWERCGKSKEERAVYSCPQCNKTFMSEGGLVYHARLHQRNEQLANKDSKPSTSPDPVEKIRPPPSRAAAKAAAEKLSELCAESSVSVGVQVGGNEIPEMRKSDRMVDTFGFTSDEMAVFRLTLERDFSITCPIERCNRKFTTFPGLRYHLKRHINSNTMQCPICRRVVAGRRRFENHVRKHHPELEWDSMNVDDCEYHPELDDDAGLSDDEFDDPETPGSKRQRRTMLLIADAPVTLGQYQDALKEKIKQLCSHAPCKQEEAGTGEKPTKSHPLVEDWIEVQDSELGSYLPDATQSMSYAVGGDTGPDSTLPLFGSTEYSGGAAMLFSGGPVWSMDWLNVREDGLGEQYVALTAYQDYDEMFPIEAQLSHKGLIQLWSAGDLANKQRSPDVQSLPRMCLGIAHTFGCIRAIKACPHANQVVGVAKEYAPVHLGVVVLACSDGCVRILNIPDPAHLSTLLPPKKATKGRSKHATFDPSILFVKPRQVAAMLVPCGLGIQDWSSFGQCLCVDWFPGNQHMRIAAGFYNGYVCVWDLHSSLLKSDSPPSSARQQLHPLVQITGHNQPCRALAWCPHDSNYLATGGHCRSLSLWDIRQPFSPIEKQDKGVLSLEIVWPLLWCHTLLQYDSSLNLVQPHSVHHCSYIFKQPHTTSTKLVTSNLAPLCSMSYSDWTDRVASSSFAGEVSVTSFDAQNHVSAIHKAFLSYNKKHKTVCHCYAKPLEDSTDGGSDEQLPIDTPTAVTETPAAAKTLKEKTKTHRLIFSSEPLSESEPCAYRADTVPLAVFTKICWNPNPLTADWMLLGTNSGLVQLLYLPRN